MLQIIGNFDEGSELLEELDDLLVSVLEGLVVGRSAVELDLGLGPHTAVESG